MTTQNEGWQFTNTNEIEWKQAKDSSLFKLIGSVDGLAFSISDIPAGHRGIPHHHTHAEFVYVMEGSVRANGVLMEAGHGYAAQEGTDHFEFVSETGCKFISVFKIGQPPLKTD